MSDTKDYYETLELKRDCSQEAIAEAFRRLSLKHHPKNATSKTAAISEYQFNKIAEAYEVLSDRKITHIILIANKKGLFDIYGKEGLNNGIQDKNGNLKGGYKYAGNAHEIFEKFMGTKNPFALLRDSDRMEDDWGSAFSSAFGGQSAKEVSPLDDIIVDLECTLEELYNGCIKNVVYKKNALNGDQRTTSAKSCEIDVEVFKGYDKTTAIPFPGMGNESPGMKTSNLSVKIVEKPHTSFKRVNKDDLIYIQRITLVQALNSEPVNLTTLDGRKLPITMDEIISPQTVKTVKGEGMPIYVKDRTVKNLSLNAKGNLYIKFDISFPEFIDPMKKEEIIRLLSSD